MPGGKQQHDEHAQPDAQLKDPAQPVGQGQRLMKVQQQPAEGPYGVRQAGRGQQPSDGIPGPFPRQQRADRGEGGDEHDYDHHVQPVPPVGQLRGQRVHGGIADRGCGRRHRDGPD